MVCVLNSFSNHKFLPLGIMEFIQLWLITLVLFGFKMFFTVFSPSPSSPPFSCLFSPLSPPFFLLCFLSWLSSSRVCHSVALEMPCSDSPCMCHHGNYSRRPVSFMSCSLSWQDLERMASQIFVFSFIKMYVQLTFLKINFYLKMYHFLLQLK